MEQVREVLKGPDIIPLTVLVDLGRRSLRDAFKREATEMPLTDIEQLWLRIQRTACSPAVADNYLTAACNALCVFLRCVCDNSQYAIRAFGFSKEVWVEGFQVVRRTFNDGKNKPAVQVLDTLIQILQEHEDQSTSMAILQEVIDEMVRILVTGQPFTRAKEACIILSSCLRKAQNVVALAQYFQSWGSDTETSFQARCRQFSLDIQHVDRCCDKKLARFLLALLLTASVREASTAAIKLFSLLCTRTEKNDFSQNVGVASLIIEAYLQANDGVLNDFSVDVFPAVLNDHDQFKRFLEQFDPAKDFNTSRLAVFFAILQVGRQKSFVTETDLPIIIKKALDGKFAPRDQDLEEYAGFRHSLMCAIPTIRLQAFSLLTSSNATNAPVPAGVLQCLTQSFRYLHDDSDSEYRDMLTSLSRRLVNRLESSGRIVHGSEYTDPASNQNVLENYSLFLQSWNLFLLLELSPQVSYQRHILALRILHLTIPFSKTPAMDASTSGLDKLLKVALLNLLFDAYDDVRSEAGVLLVQLAIYDRNLTRSSLEDFRLVELSRCLSANTNRADHADALGRLIMLAAYISRAAMELVSANEYSTPVLTLSVNSYLASISVLTPSSIFPLHGSLLGLCYSVRLAATRLDQGILVNLLQTCQRVWKLVQDDLCIDSPETELEENQDPGSEGPKDLLAYSWRALRDSSLLMQALLDTQPSHHDLCRSLGDLCFDQLKRLRHRGAFSTVAQTFMLCCHKSRISNDRLCNDLNKPWLEAAFGEIIQQSSKLTRRSAGLPSMFAALLDPAMPKQFLSGVQRLVHIARKVAYIQDTQCPEETRLPQVHALNCLKDIMTNSRFRVITESLVTEMLTLASECLSYEIWAIRNCGLMLFRACIDRLTPDSLDLSGSHTDRLDATEIQTPLDVALELLQAQILPASQADKVSSQSVGKQSENVFAALDLLGRISSQPRSYEITNHLITAQFSSGLWAVRDYAARLRATNSLDDDHIVTVELLSSLNSRSSANEQHSWLLCARHLLQNGWPRWNSARKEGFSQSILPVLSRIGAIGCSGGLHPIVLAAALDLLNDVFAIMLAEGVDCSAVATCSATYQRDEILRPSNWKHFSLRRSFALSQAYICIYHSQATDDDGRDANGTDLVCTVPTEELEITSYVVEELERRLATAYPAQILRIFFAIALSATSEGTRSLVYLRISGILPHTKLSISDSTLKALIDSLKLWQPHSRDLWNGQIRLVAALFSHVKDSIFFLDQAPIGVLASSLRMSQQDEIEMPTRRHAAQAIADLVPTLANVGKTSRTASISTTIRMQILMVLYDLLNDDDERIREIAANSTYKFTRACHHLKYAMNGCAAAARETLLDYMMVEFATSTQFVAFACIQVVGAKHSTLQSEVECVVNFCRNNPVARTVQTVLDRANDLFAEERQNLYIDDIANIEAWTTAVKPVSLEMLGSGAIDVLVSWVCEGLDALSTLLNTESSGSNFSTTSIKARERDIVHPLGLTYNTDILTTHIRVISLATLLQSTQIHSHQNTVTDRLRSLQASSQRCGVHQRVLLALERSLNN